MKCQHGINHKPLTGRIGQFMIMEMTPKADKKVKADKPKVSKQPDRGTFGWDNIDVVL
jgi:hypothetical protein